MAQGMLADAWFALALQKCQIIVQIVMSTISMLQDIPFTQVLQDQKDIPAEQLKAPGL